MREYEDAEIDYDDIITETPAACLFDLGDGEQAWIPKSQIKHLDEDGHTFTIPEWLANSKGLI